MKTVFNFSDKPHDTITLEALNSAYRTQYGISTESLNTFVGKLKDRLGSVVKTLTFQYDDKIFQALLAHRYELSAKIKEIEFHTFKDNITVRPANFQGRYVPYVETLHKYIIKENFLEEAMGYLKEVNMAIGLVINSEKEGGARVPYGIKQSIVKAEKTYTTILTDVGRFFGPDKGATRTTFDQLLNGWNDVPVIIKHVEGFNNQFNFKMIDEVAEYAGKVSDNVAELLSLLEQGHLNTHFGANNSEAGRERKIMQEAVWQAALIVELTSYLYTNLFDLTGALKVNVKDILKF